MAKSTNDTIQETESVKEKSQSEQVKTFADINRERISRTVEKDPENAKAIIATNFETKYLAENLFTINMVFQNLDKVAHKININTVYELRDEFRNAAKSLDKIVEIAKEHNIIRPQGEFKKHKNTVLRLLRQGKTAKEIAMEINIPEHRVAGWIRNMVENGEAKEIA